MGEEAKETRRPSIATIFNPKKTKAVPPTRPSVVVTDEDSPGPPLQLTNGGGGGGKRGPNCLSIGSHRAASFSGVSSSGPSLHVTSSLPNTDAEPGECFQKYFLYHKLIILTVSLLSASFLREKMNHFSL